MLFEPPNITGTCGPTRTKEGRQEMPDGYGLTYIKFPTFSTAHGEQKTLKYSYTNMWYEDTGLFRAEGCARVIRSTDDTEA